MTELLQKSPLGKKIAYQDQYDPALLFPLPRQSKRDEIGVTDALPFHGVDIWNAYEISWLDPHGKPQVAIAECYVPCESPNLIESKSFKLYLNSFNQTAFESLEKVRETLQNDLSQAAEHPIQLKLIPLAQYHVNVIPNLPGTLIDDVDIDIHDYQLKPDYLKTSEKNVQETLTSNLLKSNCLATGQPDWASVMIRYEGPQIQREGLLKYLISYRQHQEFHEQCVERIFVDIKKYCQPEKLSVYARFTRRGGLDINPFRSNFEDTPGNERLFRQ